MNLRELKSLPVRTCEEILREQVALVAKANSDSDRFGSVRITVGPHILVGVPAKIEERRGNEPWLVLVHRDDVSYIPLRSIATVTVENYYFEPVPEAPSKLNVDRYTKEVADSNKDWAGGKISIKWPGGEVSENDRLTAMQTLKALSGILSGILSDKLGREAINEIKQIDITPASGREMSVTRDGKTLSLTVGMAADLTGNELGQLIEQNL